MEEVAEPVGSLEKPGRSPKSSAGERRGSARYPLDLELRYSIAQQGKQLETGSGRVVDFSSSGLRFVADRPLQPGVKIELAVNWPSVLDGGVRLQLIASGTVVRSRGTEIAAQIQRHEFRTRGAGVKFRVA